MSIVILKQRSDFLRLKESKKKFFTEAAVIVFDKSPEVKFIGIRLAFIVTKKIGNAVHRNRARRRLRAAVRMAYNLMAIKDLDIIFIARKNALTVKFSDMVSSFVEVLQKLQLQSNNE